MWRVNLQVNGLPVDSLIVARNTSRLGLNFAADLIKVVESLAGKMQELAELGLLCNCLRGMRSRLGGSISTRRDIDELQNQRTTSDNSGTAG